MTLNGFFAFLSDNTELVWTAVRQHIAISFTAVLLGFLIAFPCGILLARSPKAAGVTLGIFGVVNTIPSLVLLGVAMMVLGIGFVPAVAVLFLYSLLPIMRNTYIGIKDVDPQYIKAATGLGMNRMQLLRRIQIPLAAPVIIAGIRLSAVYVISWGTLAAFIGAGGLGDLIWMGLQSYNYNLVFSGALPATILALVVSFLLSMVEKLFQRRRHEEVQQ